MASIPLGCFWQIRHGTGTEGFSCAEGSVEVGVDGSSGISIVSRAGFFFQTSLEMWDNSREKKVKGNVGGVGFA